jgi:glycyl-tRNA synthetase beta chain
VHVSHVAAVAADKARAAEADAGGGGAGRRRPADPGAAEEAGRRRAPTPASCRSCSAQPDGKAEALFLDSLVPGATLADGLQKALDEALAKLPIPKVMHQLPARRRLDQREVRAPGAWPGGAARRRRGAGVGAGPEVRAADAGPPLRGGGGPGHAAGRRQLRRQLREQGAVIASFAARRAEIVRQLQAAARPKA